MCLLAMVTLAVEIQSATNLHSGQTTPYPKAVFKILLANKKRKLEAEEDKKRSNYPQASKSVYLKTKTLHRRKLSLTTNINQIKKLLTENKFPLQANFNSKVPMTRDQVKDQWLAITNKCKTGLSNLILQDLSAKYQTTKLEIYSNLAQLQNLLTNSQFVEIKEFLQTKYKQAMSTTFSKMASKLEKRKPEMMGKGPPSGRRQVAPKRQTKGNQNKTDIKSLLVNILQTL